MLVCSVRSSGCPLRCLALSIWVVARQYRIDCASLDLDNVSISCDPLIPQRHVLGLKRETHRERARVSYFCIGN